MGTKRESIVKSTRFSLPVIACAALAFTCCMRVITMSSLSPSERSDIQTDHYSAASDSVIYQGATSALLMLGYSLQMSDPVARVVQTRPLEYPADVNRDALAVGLLGYPARLRRSVSARVQDGELTVNISWEATDRFGWRPHEPKVDDARSEYSMVTVSIRGQVEKMVGKSMGF